MTTCACVAPILLIIFQVKEKKSDEHKHSVSKPNQTVLTCENHQQSVHLKKRKSNISIVHVSRDIDGSLNRIIIIICKFPSFPFPSDKTYRCTHNLKENQQQKVFVCGSLFVCLCVGVAALFLSRTQYHTQLSCASASRKDDTYTLRLSGCIKNCFQLGI